MCLDPGISIENADNPPPIYICTDCVDQLQQEHVQFLVDILQPMGNVSLTCDHKVGPIISNLFLRHYLEISFSITELCLRQQGSCLHVFLHWVRQSEWLSSHALLLTVPQSETQWKLCGFPPHFSLVHPRCVALWSWYAGIHCWGYCKVITSSLHLLFTF